MLDYAARSPFLFATAEAEEIENVDYFGDGYQDTCGTPACSSGLFLRFRCLSVSGFKPLNDRENLWTFSRNLASVWRYFH